ncbi:hypothetical protein [Weissella viridescens]|uniref:hypothetical protein n=1 Tax=Weissella viridescens TaxID=1629 RepID=UPI003AF2F6DC
MVKKIDFHLHTVPSSADASIKDERFDYSSEWLREYVSVTNLDAIAITNHNLFDKHNYEEIENEFKDICVFPGMEISLETGHVNLIYSNEPKYVEELDKASVYLESMDRKKSITVEEFIDIFPNYREAILVFETGKSNSLQKPEQLIEGVSVAGVQNSLRFQKMWNQSGNIVPVLFSDGHATKNGKDRGRSDIKKLSEKNTYIQCENSDFNSIKKALRKKDNVNIFRDELHDSFEIDGKRVSTGLNLIVGRRGTGKTVFIDKIQEHHPNSTYRISQFESTNQDEFLENEQKNRKRLAIEAWKSKFDTQISAIENLINEPKASIPNNYMDELKQYAEDVVKYRSRSLELFNEQDFDLINLSWVEENLVQIKKLIHSDQLWDYVDNSYMYKETLISLYNNVRIKYKKQFIDNEEKRRANNLIGRVKSIISSHTGQRILPSCDFSKVVRQAELTSKVNEWVDSFEETTLDTQDLMGYQIKTEMKPFKSANEIQQQLHTKTKVSDALVDYSRKDYFEYLLKLKNRGTADTSLLDNGIIECLFRIDTKLLNDDGGIASGGQSVALALTLSLDKASREDIILVDEPEASLDNSFIKERLIPKLQELSKTHTVFVITHNSTLGALLDPDYLIVAKKDSHGNHSILTGDYSSKNLSDSTGAEFKSYDDFIDAMEAGVETFNQKGRNYNDLRN